jgi:hypothetical protein
VNALLNRFKPIKNLPRDSVTTLPRVNDMNDYLLTGGGRLHSEIRPVTFGDDGDGFLERLFETHQCLGPRHWFV